MSSSALKFHHHDLRWVAFSLGVIMLAAFAARRLMARPAWSGSGSDNLSLPFNREWQRMPAVVRFLAGLCLFEAVYYLALKGGLAFTAPFSAPLWFPDSIMLCTLLLASPRRWWVFLLAALSVRLLLQQGALSFLLWPGYLNNSLKAIAAAVLLRRFVPNLGRLGHLREFTIFLLITVLIVPALSAFGGASVHTFLGENYWVAWVQWFLGDSLVNLVVTTAILYWLFDGYSELRTPARYLEAVVVGVGIVLASVKAFGHSGESSLALIYAPVPFLLWAAVRFGPRGAATTLFVLAFISIRVAAQGRGPYSLHSPVDNVLAIQIFLFVIGGPLLFLASLLKERQRTEGSLRESQDRYRALIDNFPGGNTAVFDKHFRIQFVGGADTMNYGSPDAFVGKLLSEVAPAETCAVVEPNLRLAFQGQKVTYETPYKGGTRYRATATPLYSKDGTISEVMTVAANITEQDRAKAALEESEKRFRLLAEVTNDAIWDWDLKTNGLWWNEGFETLFGYGRDEIEKTIQSWYDRIHPAERDRVVSGVHQVIDEGGVTWSDEYRFLCKNGNYAYVLDRGQVLRNGDGKGVRMVGGMRDLTERNRAEEAAQAFSAELLRAQDEERRRIARELHDSTAQELAVVAMNLGRLEEWIEGRDPWAENLLADSLAVLGQGNRELRTIAHLLHPPMLEELGLIGALRDYVEGFSARSGIEVSMEAAEDFQRCPAQVETALFRIVQESLSNVHRHSGSRVVLVRLVRDRDVIELSISDRGKGLPAGLLLGTARESRVGVGISGMRQRISQLRGRLEITSNGNGTTISAVLPFHLKGIGNGNSSEA